MYSRSVHGDFHFLGVCFGTGIFASTHGGCGHYGVGGVFSGIDGDACIMLIVNGDIALFPFVGDSAIGIVSNGGNAEFCAAAVTDSGLASDVVKRNRRSVHIHGETLGVGGGAVYIVGVDCSRGHHGINGGVAGIVSDGSGVPSVLGAVVTPSVGEFAVSAVSNDSDGEGGSISALADGHRIHVSQLYSRSVHGHFHALAGGDGAGLVVFAYSGSGRYNISGIAGGRYRNGVIRLLGVPYVGNIPFGASGGADGKLGFTTGADGGGAGNFIQHNGRSVHIHGEALGGGGGTGVIASAQGGRGNYGINGGVGGSDSDGSSVPSVLGAVVAPSVGEFAVGSVSDGSDAECGSAARTDGAVAGDVGQLD